MFMLYICTKFHENIPDSITVIERTRFPSENSKGTSFFKNCRWSFEFLFSARHLMMVYICIKFHENIFNCIRVMECTRKVNGRTDGRTEPRHNKSCLRRVYNKKSRAKLFSNSASRVCNFIRVYCIQIPKHHKCLLHQLTICKANK